MALWARAKPQPPNDTDQTLEGWATTLFSTATNNTETELITSTRAAIIPPQTYALFYFHVVKDAHYKQDVPSESWCIVCSL